MSPQWWSQRFAPEGSAAGEGIAKQLGRPLLDPLTVLVRESAQNSWDARTGDERLSFHIGVRRLGDLARAWRDVLTPPPHPEANVDLYTALDEESHLLLVSDRGTVGLGGPLRAGQRAVGPQRPDFVQFLRNVGEPSDHAFGGGTYGFGKGILYRLSSASTILVNTHTVDGEWPRRRLMAATLGHSWYLGDQRYTGRHWWGSVAEDDVPDPVLGDAASSFARRLGLPGFDDGRTGTDVVILGADLGLTGEEGDLRPRTAPEAATYIASSILWHLWPKAVDGGEDVTVDFSVDVDGRALDMPEPQQVADLRPFVDSLSVVRQSQGRPYGRTARPRHAGSFACSLAGAATGPSARRQMATVARPFDGPSHHVARMRDAELIVDYLPGPAHPDPLLCYGAVFKASREADPHFALAEPPTHDDWIDKGLSGVTRGVVQGARRFVLREVDDFLGTRVATGTGEGGLGGLAARLSSLLPLTASSLPTPDNDRVAERRMGSGAGSGGGSGRAAQSRVLRLTQPPKVYTSGGRPFLAARLAVPASQHRRTVSVDVLVVTQGGGVEGEPPLGDVRPEIEQWQSVEGGLSLSGSTLSLPPGDASEWWVVTRHVPDAVVRFRPRQEEHRAD